MKSQVRGVYVTRGRKGFYSRITLPEDRKAKFDLLKADRERKQYERTHPTLSEMMNWTKLGA